MAREPGTGYAGARSTPASGSRYADVEELRRELNIPRELSDEETERAEGAIDAASAEIESAIGAYYGRAARPPWSDTEYALANRVCLARAVEWWKAADAAFNIIGNSEMGMLRAPREGFARHYLALVPLIERFGIA